jgi:hypothetical protein
VLHLPVATGPCRCQTEPRPDSIAASADEAKKQTAYVGLAKILRTKAKPPLTVGCPANANVAFLVLEIRLAGSQRSYLSR